MIAVIHQPQFLPYLGFFHKLVRGDVFVLLDDVMFTDSGFQHRNRIKTRNGTQMLTVPVTKKSGQLINEVQLAPNPWRRKCWASIQANYSRAPFFDELAPAVQEIVLEGSHARLVDLGGDLFHWAVRTLEIGLPIHVASELALPETTDPDARLIGMCRKLGADTYLSGPGGRDYMNLAAYADAGVRVVFQKYSAREYPQQFEDLGFIPNLAIVDALFNVGPAATRDLIDTDAAKDGCSGFAE